MGCTSAHQQQTSVPLTLRGDPEIKDVALKDGSSMRVGLASDSLVYSVLASHADGAVFIDAQPRQKFDQAHIYSAWCLDALSEGSAAKVDVGNNEQPGGGAAAAWETALRARCSLRTLVIYGAQEAAVKDERVLHVLEQLHRLGVRPKGQPLVLRRGLADFTHRFSFCIRRKGGERDQPLPPCAAEILPPGGGQQRPRALYLGTERCVHEPDTDKVLGALGVQTIINLSGKPCKPRRRKCHVVNIAGGDNGSLVARAKEACEKVARQSAPCLVYGSASALAVALYLADGMPAVAGSADEAEAFVRLRFPQAAVLDEPAKASLRWATAKNAPKGSAASSKAAAAAAAAAASPAPAPPVLARPVAAAAPPELVASAVALPAGSTEAAAPHRHDSAEQQAASPSAPTYVEEVAARLQKKFRSKAALNTVRAALTHVLEHPTEPKFRRLRGGNERVKREVLAHQEAVILLRLAGFISDGEDLVLPPTAPLQALRDVLAHLPPAQK